jgi:hypothetical protein
MGRGSEAGFQKYKPEVHSLVVPGFGKVEHQFLVEGKGEITIQYECQHAGKIKKAVELKQGP